MTERERQVAVVAAVIALAMLLFPPWHGTARGVVFNLGYHFIGDGPQLGEIDFARLLIQLVVVGIIAFGAARFLPRA